MASDDVTRVENEELQGLLRVESAKVLSVPTVSRPYWGGRSPRWICRVLNAKACVPVDGGVWRSNQLVESFLPIQSTTPTTIERLPTGNLQINHSHLEGAKLDISYAAYDESPREIALQPIQTVMRMHTRVHDLYSDHHDQLLEQLGFAAEVIYETKENLIFNHPDYGLVNNVKPRLQIDHDGPPTPELLDRMLAHVWKMPDLFVMHPEALHSFRDEANTRGLTLETVTMFGAAFSCWRGIPILPTNKLHLTSLDGADVDVAQSDFQARKPGESRTDVLLMRVGEKKQGVLSLYARDVAGTATFPFIDIQFMGLSEGSIASYLLTTYAAMAVSTPGALAGARVVI
jgi:hypothetical protein